MKIFFWTIAIDGLVDTDLQRSYAGDVKKSTIMMIRIFLSDQAHLLCTLICFKDFIPPL
jgi:hypothetical protein